LLLERSELDGLLKVTNRAIEIQIVWKKIFMTRADTKKYPWLIEAVNRSIAELSEYKLDLKNMLKGNNNLSVSEKLRFLMEEIERAEDPDAIKIYSQKLVKLTEGFLSETLLEVMNGQS